MFSEKLLVEYLRRELFNLKRELNILASKTVEESDVYDLLKFKQIDFTIEKYKRLLTEIDDKTFHE